MMDLDNYMAIKKGVSCEIYPLLLLNIIKFYLPCLGKSNRRLWYDLLSFWNDRHRKS